MEYIVALLFYDIEKTCGLFVILVILYISHSYNSTNTSLQLWTNTLMYWIRGNPSTGNMVSTGWKHQLKPVDTATFWGFCMTLKL